MSWRRRRTDCWSCEAGLEGWRRRYAMGRVADIEHCSMGDASDGFLLRTGRCGRRARRAVCLPM